MAEYIEREACLSILRAKANMAVLMDAAPYFEKAAKMLEKLPAADVVEVVRCEDCKYHYDCGVHFCDRFGMDCPDDSDFFCAYGERKNGGDDHA